LLKLRRGKGREKQFNGLRDSIGGKSCGVDRRRKWNGREEGAVRKKTPGGGESHGNKKHNGR